MQNTYYRIGLGTSFLYRARFIFVIIIVAFFALGTATVYAGITSGELESTVIQPAQHLIADLQKTVTTLQENENHDQLNGSMNASTSASSSSQTIIEINTSTNTAGQAGTPKVYYRPVSPYPTTHYTYPTPIDQDAWWKQAQEENRQKSLESQKASEEFRKQSEQRMKEFDAQTNAELTQFQEQYGH